MPKPIISALGAGLMAAGIAAMPISASAADLLLPYHHRVAGWCGRCGCLHLNYVYHREVETTYGAGFDPRNFDQAVPYFYWGRTRAYPRYWVDADPAQ